MAKRWGKERERDDSEPSEELLEEMLGTMIPIACAGDQCEKRAHVMLPGESPYEAGFFMGKGWTAVVTYNLNSGGIYPLHREGGRLLLEEIGKFHM